MMLMMMVVVAMFTKHVHTTKGERENGGWWWSYISVSTLTFSPLSTQSQLGRELATHTYVMCSLLAGNLIVVVGSDGGGAKTAANCPVVVFGRMPQLSEHTAAISSSFLAKTVPLIQKIESWNKREQRSYSCIVQFFPVAMFFCSFFTSVFVAFLNCLFFLFSFLPLLLPNWAQIAYDNVLIWAKKEIASTCDKRGLDNKPNWVLWVPMAAVGDRLRLDSKKEKK